MSISDLGEFELIARLTSGLPIVTGKELGVGDDCAVLDIHGSELLLVTCDSQVEGVHFTRQTSTAEQIGRKAMAINVSDIAAMGGKPLYAFVSLILPKELPLAFLDEVYAGLRQEAETHGTSIMGGNVSGSGPSAQLIIDITVLGTVERGHVLTRTGAKVGDVLCVTGSLGDSAAGLYTLLHPENSYPVDALKMVRAIHTTPTPRVREGRVLSRFGPKIVTSLLDISDGLSGDLEHICERSEAGCMLELSRLPLSHALRQVAQEVGVAATHWSLHGGEDYELLFSVSPIYVDEVVHAVTQETGTSVTRIGTITVPGEGITLFYPDGHREKLVTKSWDHLRN